MKAQKLSLRKELVEVLDQVSKGIFGGKPTTYSAGETYGQQCELLVTVSKCDLCFIPAMTECTCPVEVTVANMTCHFTQGAHLCTAPC